MTDDEDGPLDRFRDPRSPVAALVSLAGAVIALAGVALGVGTALVGGTALLSAGLIALVLLSIPEEADRSGTDPGAEDETAADG